MIPRLLSFALIAAALAVSSPAFAESSHPVTSTGTIVIAPAVTAPAVGSLGAVAQAPAAAPAKLSREHLLELQLDAFKFADMDREITGVREAAEKLRASRDAILKLYGINVDDVGKSVTIMPDGTIKRADAPPAAAAVAPPAKQPTKLAKKK